MIRAALTVEEALEGMKTLEPKIKNYARLVVRKGVNVKPGQEVVVQSPVECASFARVMVAEAYDAGAGHVTVIWADDAVTRLTYEHVEKSYFEQNGDGTDILGPSSVNVAIPKTLYDDVKAAIQKDLDAFVEENGTPDFTRGE